MTVASVPYKTSSLTLRGALQNTAGQITAGSTAMTADQLNNQSGTLLTGADQTLHLRALNGDGLSMPATP